jgi:hypothetical protein
MPGLPGFDHLQGHLKLGAVPDGEPGQGSAIARSRKAEPYDLLFLDEDHNGSLEGEEPVSTTPGTNRNKLWSNFRSSVPVRHNVGGTTIWQDYPLTFWVVTDTPEQVPNVIRFTRIGYFTGSVLIDGNTQRGQSLERNI